MLVRHSAKAKPFRIQDEITAICREVDESRLQQVVKQISIPRHFNREAAANQLIGTFVAEQLQEYGYRVQVQGRFANIFATGSHNKSKPLLLVGAHYDSVPGTPGADDNASAVAGMLECARIMARFQPEAAMGFAAFNCEEDGLIGSRDFVEGFVLPEEIPISQVHILEMIGYCRTEPRSQHLPVGLPIRLPERGDFLGLITNSTSNPIGDKLVRTAKTYVPGLPVLGLKVYFGLEKSIPVLGRSDHDSFWKAGIPAVMWTDTAEFRNPHYHQPSDRPETLDYQFLQRVTQVLVAHCLLETGVGK